MVDLLVTYLEMNAPPLGEALPVPAGFAIEAERLSMDGYLALYRAVGGPFQWDARLRMAPADLAAFLIDPATIIFVLRDQGRAVGLCEFSGIGSESVELTNFGIVPEMQGRGLGPVLLGHALRTCWRDSTKRVWLRTDTNDHPKAIATYERAGLRRTIQRVESFPD